MARDNRGRATPFPLPRPSTNCSPGIAWGADSGWTDHFAAFPADWEDATATVQAELERPHGDDPCWQTAQEQSSRMGLLLAAGEVRGRMLVLQPA